MENRTDDIENGISERFPHRFSRLDIKQNPYMKTEVWLIWTPIIMVESKNTSGSFSMAIHGVIVKTDGTTVINIGGKTGETGRSGDRHSGASVRKTDGEKGSVVVEGEVMDLLVGSQPMDKKKMKRKKIR